MWWHGSRKAQSGMRVLYRSKVKYKIKDFLIRKCTLKIASLFVKWSASKPTLPSIVSKPCVVYFEEWTIEWPCSRATPGNPLPQDNLPSIRILFPYTIGVSHHNYRFSFGRRHDLRFNPLKDHSCSSLPSYILRKVRSRKGIGPPLWITKKWLHLDRHLDRHDRLAMYYISTFSINLLCTSSQRCSRHLSINVMNFANLRLIESLHLSWGDQKPCSPMTRDSVSRQTLSY